MLGVDAAVLGARGARDGRPEGGTVQRAARLAQSSEGKLQEVVESFVKGEGEEEGQGATGREEHADDEGGDVGGVRQRSENVCKEMLRLGDLGHGGTSYSMRVVVEGRRIVREREREGERERE